MATCSSVISIRKQTIRGYFSECVARLLVIANLAMYNQSLTSKSGPNIGFQSHFSELFSPKKRICNKTYSVAHLIQALLIQTSDYGPC